MCGIQHLPLSLLSQARAPLAWMRSRCFDDPTKNAGRKIGKLKLDDRFFWEGLRSHAPCVFFVDMGVSKNRGTPKWMVYSL